jgi:hypothetical protein
MLTNESKGLKRFKVKEAVFIDQALQEIAEVFLIKGKY